MAEHAPQNWAPPAPGFFPAGPARPTYREPHPVTTGPLLIGMGATLLWLALFGAIGQNLMSYAWWTVGASISAWVVALVLTAIGDRGVAAGVAIMSGIGLSVAMGFVTYRWITTNDWPMW